MDNKRVVIAGEREMRKQFVQYRVCNLQELLAFLMVHTIEVCLIYNIRGNLLREFLRKVNSIERPLFSPTFTIDHLVHFSIRDFDNYFNFLLNFFTHLSSYMIIHWNIRQGRDTELLLNYYSKFFKIPIQSNIESRKVLFDYPATTSVFSLQISIQDSSVFFFYPHIELAKNMIRDRKQLRCSRCSMNDGLLCQCPNGCLICKQCWIQSSRDRCPSCQADLPIDYIQTFEVQFRN